MSLKAGRVGVAPDQVDEFGKVKSEVTSGYTKQEADAKFETQEHAASTYETKTDAADLQPKTLEVPIEMLSGTKLTVESALQGLNDVVTCEPITVSVTSQQQENIELDRVNAYKVGSLVVIRVQAHVINTLASGTDIMMCNEPHANYGESVLLNTNSGDIVPVLVTGTSNTVFRLKGNVSAGWYAMNYTYIAE